MTDYLHLRKIMLRYMYSIIVLVALIDSIIFYQIGETGTSINVNQQMLKKDSIETVKINQSQKIIQNDVDSILTIIRRGCK